MTAPRSIRLTPLGVLAMSLLVERPMHPYEMLQTLRTRRSDRLVKLGPGGLYHTVDRLVRDGLAEAEGTEREGNRPDRTIYRPTALGREVIAETLVEMLVTPEPEYPRFPVALSELNNLPRDEAIEVLSRRAERLRVDGEQYSAASRMLAERPLPKRYWLQLDYQHAVLEAELDWIQRTLHDLRSGSLEWSDPQPAPVLQETP